MIRNVLYKGFSLMAEGAIRGLTADSYKPGAAQQKKLLSIVRKNQETLFGKEHCFRKVFTTADFQQAVPIREYELLRPYVERATLGEASILTADAIQSFATTSGTSGQPKYIPVTEGYMEEFRIASVVSGYNLLRAFPGISRGATLSLVSPAIEGQTAGGIPYGAISGQLFKKEPLLIKKFISPIPYEVFLIKDYEAKYYTLLRLALCLPLSCFYTLNPSTIALLCRRLSQHAASLIDDVRYGRLNGANSLPAETVSALQKWLVPDQKRAAALQELLDAGEFLPHKIWPELAVVSCWTKAAAGFYLGDFPKFFGDVPICDITYGASEGRGTVLMAPGKQMLAIHSHFFEFVAEEDMDKQNPQVLLPEQLQSGKNYFILFTTSAGLYRYHINDVVKVTGFFNQTPMLEFQYKGGNVSSFTGEKLTELQVTSSVSQVISANGICLRFFTLVAEFAPDPHYDIWLEFDPVYCSNIHQQKRLASIIANQLDIELGRQNIEYAAKRESGRLGPIGHRLFRMGAYEDFRKYLVSTGVPDAQIKVSHLAPKPDVLDVLAKDLLDDVKQLHVAGYPLGAG